MAKKPLTGRSVQLRTLEKALENVRLDDLGTPDFPLDLTEENIQRFRDLIMAENPEIKHLFDMLEKMDKDRAEQAQNPTVVIRNRRGEVTPELLKKYLKTSPTARETLKAYRHFETACKIILSYPRKRVETEADCCQIGPAFRHYIEGYVIAQFMISQFPFPPIVEQFVEDFLKLRPNDLYAGYFHVLIIVNMKSNSVSEFEGYKMRIRALEEFANKIQPYKSEEPVKKVLGHVYFMLGAQYTITDQDARALDSFQKWHETEPDNLEAQYSVAYHLKETEPDKAIKMLTEYISKAPKCAEKYPNAFYLLGYIYALTYNNVQEALKFYQLGEEAETFRLPFNPETEFLPKTFLQTMLIVHRKEEKMEQKGSASKLTKKKVANSLDELD